MTRPDGLVTRLRRHTRELHRAAERSGIVSDLLHRRADRRGYSLYLRNLLPAYEAMEAALECRAGSSGYECIADRRLFRSPAIRADLCAIAGRPWQYSLPELPVARRYADWLMIVAQSGDLRLLGHTYTRCLGDLSGGVILGRLVSTSLSLPPEALRFFDFRSIGDVAHFRERYLDAIDQLAAGTCVETIVAEAITAFRFNIELSVMVAEISRHTPRAEMAAAPD